MGRMKETFLDDRPYPQTPGWKAPGTSQEAATSTRGRKAALQARVIEAFTAAGKAGLTADQAASKIGESVLAVRPRVSELSEMGLIEKTGSRRPNASGLNATVWRLKP